MDSIFCIIPLLAEIKIPIQMQIKERFGNGNAVGNNEWRMNGRQKHQTRGSKPITFDGILVCVESGYKP